MPDYEAHLQAHPVSVLCRICGMHSVRLSSEQRFITIMVQVSICLAFAPSLGCHTLMRAFHPLPPIPRVFIRLFVLTR